MSVWRGRSDEGCTAAHTRVPACLPACLRGSGGAVVTSCQCKHTLRNRLRLDSEYEGHSRATTSFIRVRTTRSAHVRRQLMNVGYTCSASLDRLGIVKVASSSAACLPLATSNNYHSCTTIQSVGNVRSRAALRLQCFCSFDSRTY